MAGSGRRDPAGRAWVALVASALVAAGCSLIVDQAASQCATDGDCARFPGTACQQGACVVREAGPGDDGAAPADVTLDIPPVTACTSTQDCLPDYQGANWICRKSDATCVSVITHDCPGPIAGDYKSDDVVLVGALVPLGGPYANIGGALQDSLRLAANDFSQGLPPAHAGGNPRPLALIVCDESDDVTRAAGHLRDDLHVPLILGTAFSASTLAVAHDVEVDASAGLPPPLLMSPGASSDLSSVASTGLVWRTIPSDAYQAAAIDALVGRLEPALKAQHGGEAKMRVAVVHQADVYGTELAQRVTSGLVFNGVAATDPANAGYFTDVDYGNPDDPASDPNPAAAYAKAIDALTQDPAVAPDLVLLMGYPLGVTKVLAETEMGWPSAATYRPQYVLSNGMESTDLLAVIGGNDGLRTRILGTAPGTDPGVSQDMSRFVSLYRLTYTDGTTPFSYATANAYDAFYAAAFGIAAARNVDVVGADVVAGLRKILTPSAAPVSIHVAPDQITTAFDAIQAGSPIALHGVSGPLQFDLTKGDVVADVQVWCVVRGPGADGGTGLGFAASGLSYTSTAAAPALTGAIAASCTH